MTTSRSKSRATPRSAPRSTPGSGSGSGPRSTSQYSTWPLPELLFKWEHGELTDQQMIGHLLQHVIEQDQRIRHLEHPPKSEPA